MPRKASLYLLFGAIIIATFLLGVVAAGLFFRARPAPGPEVKAPELSEQVSLPTTQVVTTEEKVVSQKVVEAPKVTVPISAPTVKKERLLKAEFQKGMVLIAWTSNGYQNANVLKSLDQLKSLGVEWVALVVTWYQDRFNSAEVYPDKDKTPTDESLIFIIRKLHEMKFKIMFKPHLDLVDAQDKWRADIEFKSEADWQAWFDSYSAYVLHYAQLCEQENVELFCIGTELRQPTVTQPARWRELTKKMREAFGGQLTYAANWNDEYDRIEFWDALDYAGIDPYFPLVCTLSPKVEELKSAWNDWLKPIEEWQKKINKPVIFAEMGYKSAQDATDEPWQHAAMGDLNLEIQSNCYQAMLESFWDKPWFYGIYWWYWGVHPTMGGPTNRGFTPQNKPSQEVVRQWYAKPVVGKAY